MSREQNPFATLLLMGALIIVLAFFVGIAFHLGWNLV